MSDFDNLVQQFFNAYSEAVYQKDVEVFMKLYDPDVRIFDTWGAWSYEGETSWRKMIAQWFDSLNTAERVKVTFDDIKRTATQGLGFVSATGTYACVSVKGEEIRAMQNRLTWVLKQEGEIWKIIHEHTSAPITFDELKPILCRTDIN